MSIKDGANASPSSAVDESSGVVGGKEEAACIEEDFDGEASNACRGAVAVAFGLPDDLEKVASRPSSNEEFEAAQGKATRSIEALEMRGSSVAEDGALSFETAEFDASGRVGFMPIAALLQHQGTDLQAPLLPSYLRLSRTSFRSTKPLAVLVKELSSAFGACSVAAENSGIDGGMSSNCTWDCTLERALARVRLEVRVFATVSSTSSGGHHMVEVRHLSGCRYAFAEGAEALAAQLRVKFEGCQSSSGGSPLSPLRSPPPLSDSALLELQKNALLGEPPLLSDTMPQTSDETKPPTPAADAAADTTKVSSSGAEEIRTAQHVLSLLSPEADCASQIAGCRAVGALALELTNCMGSCPCAGACGANHRNHHALFASGGAWLELATRVQSLASSDSSSRSSSGISAEQQSELQSVAMAAVANVAALESVCSSWLAQAVHTASGALVAPASDDAHVKREALRAAHVLASRDAALAQQLAAVDGCLDVLELEASGGDSSSCDGNSAAVDEHAVKFAQGALDACSRA